MSERPKHRPRSLHTYRTGSTVVKSLIVIPARLASSRLPNKLLLSETGKPLLQHTYEAAAQSQIADDVLVAADDPQIVAAVQAFGGRVELTSDQHQSGTDRIAEIAERYPDVELFINVQGDEPEIDAADIDTAARLLQEQPQADMSTLATPITNPGLIEDPACVKVVFDAQQKALYFSRSPIPFAREGLEQAFELQPKAPLYYQHVGLYVYRRETLLELTAAARSTAEICESLEQLRALHIGKSIWVGLASQPSRGIDTPEDYRVFVSRHST